MAGYREKTVSGTQVTRPTRLVIENPGVGDPSVSFVEEDFLTIGTDTVSRGTGQITYPINATTKSEVFDLVNPVTGAPLGKQAKLSDLAVMYYSLYLYIAAKRDAGTLQISNANKLP